MCAGNISVMYGGMKTNEINQVMGGPEKKHLGGGGSMNSCLRGKGGGKKYFCLTNDILVG